jgi:hypothetical protein
VLEDAERLIAAWNERQAKRMPIFVSAITFFAQNKEQTRDRSIAKVMLVTKIHFSDQSVGYHFLCPRPGLLCCAFLGEKCYDEYGESTLDFRTAAGGVFCNWFDCRERPDQDRDCPIRKTRSVREHRRYAFDWQWRSPE